MSFATVQKEIESWSPEDQDRLASYLAALRLKRSGYVEEMGRRSDDKRPEKWMPLAEMKRKLGEHSAE